MNNKENIINHLIQLAKFEPITFKAAAYLTAASNISNINHENWDSVPGVGKAISSKIKELLTTGKIDKLERLKAEYKPIKKNQLYISHNEATTIISELKTDMKFEICGSYRRKRENISDIDILILDSDVEKWKHHVSNFDVKFINAGEKQFDIVYKNVLINFRSTAENGWGAGLLYLTGSGKFGQLLRGLAKRKGFKLNQYGIYKNDELIASKTEEEIFKVLNLICIIPKNR